MEKEPYGAARPDDQGECRRERWTTAVASPTDFGFTSQRREGFGLYDYNARYYSPSLGRFISPDTIVPEPGSSGGFNRYRYTRNNPLRYTDPSGHFECADAQGGCLPDQAIPIRIPDVPDEYVLSSLNELGIPNDANLDDPSNAVGRSIIEDQIIANAYQDGVIGADAYGALGQRSMGQRMGAISEGEAVAMMFAGMGMAMAGKMFMQPEGGGTIYPRGSGAAEGPVPEGYTKVSRWVNQAEASKWIENGGTTVPSGVGTLALDGTTRVYVTTLGAPKPGGTGPIRVDFSVPEQILMKAGRTEWQQIVQPVQNIPIYNVQIHLPQK